MSSSEPSRFVEEQQLLTLGGLLPVLVHVGGGLPHVRIFVGVVILYYSLFLSGPHKSQDRGQLLRSMQFPRSGRLVVAEGTF